MSTRQILAVPNTHPLRLFAIVLLSVFGVEAAVMLALPHLVPPDSGVTFKAVVDACLLTILIAPLLWGLIVRPLQRSADLRRRMLALVLSAQEDERRRIARDLHDGLGQTITSLLVGLRTIEESSTDVQAKSSLRDLRLFGAGAHEEIRRLVRGLRPVVLDDVGLIPALERLLDDVRTSHPIEVDLELDEVAQTRMSADVETALYRITQEAIANAIRHGAASRIDVALRSNANRVELAIRDNGGGFSPAKVLAKHSKKNPFGLLSICERARMLGGDAWIESSTNAGTHVRVQIPATSSERHDAKD